MHGASAGCRATSLFVICAAAFPLQSQADEGIAAGLFADVSARNKIRESWIYQYSVLRTYQVRNSSEKLRHESQVSVQYRRPGPKVFQVVHEQGSSAIRNMVI